MTNRNSEEFTKEEKSRKRLDKISKLSYFGGKRRKERRQLGKITLCCIREHERSHKDQTFFNLVQPIRARIADDGVRIHFQDETYSRAKSFRHNVREKLRTKLPPTKAKKSHRRLYSFFEEHNIDPQTTNLLLQQQRIYINGKRVRRRLGFRLGVDKGDIVRV